jgi:hypothetical protein
MNSPHYTIILNAFRARKRTTSKISDRFADLTLRAYSSS